MEIIMPCAGLSTRFPNLRPKYLLTDYSGKLMIENAAKHFIGKHNITIAILKQHNEMFNAENKLRDAFGDKVNIVVLDEPTSGPADTVYQTIMKAKYFFTSVSPMLIKDCDGFYDTDLIDGNAIYVSKLSKNPDIRNAPAKSYTITNEQGIITSVVEKQIVSDSFCVGGYQFASIGEFVDTFDKLKGSSTSEIFVSNIIDYMISNGRVFTEKEVENFIDVGTADDWFKFNNKPTYFCDIDGTIIKSKDFHDDLYEPIQGNVNALLKEQARGCKLMFVTARKKKYEDYTNKILTEMGFVNYVLVMEVNHSRRVLINDYANSNPFPSAVAINLKRDSDNLGDMI
jgi:dTDP-glucose pyrophosphorylase